ncbi:hypothetical protein RclHR1_00290011 [Rhizophagus clarus]|uniref:Uncharacterized protein n=1 Tax=Rhizophagus clarus TaxID=94130 RepID=A0A2Z6R3Y6_9GLOM|nr:hypothetical protein RclHR1_00290011 [Rhizophagus clarus]
MSCSKLFSGNLSELINKIQYLHYDYETLHSCIIISNFIENGVNLHSLVVTMNVYAETNLLEKIFELILQNPNFILNIKDLTIYSIFIRRQKMR